jgi:hypothetical protein
MVSELFLFFIEQSSHAIGRGSRRRTYFWRETAHSAIDDRLRWAHVRSRRGFGDIRHAGVVSELRVRGDTTTQSRVSIEGRELHTSQYWGNRVYRQAVTTPKTTHESGAGSRGII